MVKRLNIGSMEFTGSLVLPRNPNRSFFMLQVRAGQVNIEFNSRGGIVTLNTGESFKPDVCPTSELIITGGTYVIVSNGLPSVSLSNKVTNMELYIPEVDFVDTTTQSTTGLDVPTTVKYGPSKTSNNNFIEVDNTGVLTVLKSGYYLFKTRHRLSRTGASGVSRIFQWVELSIDNGTTWMMSGNSVDSSLSNANDVIIFNDIAAIHLLSGTKIRARWARSSTGDNSGELVPSVPSATLITAGVASAPSAQLTVYVPAQG